MIVYVVLTAIKTCGNILKMFSKTHSNILNKIIEEWKNTEGYAISIDRNTELYESIKNQANLTDNEIQLAMHWLEENGLIKRANGLLITRQEFFPTIAGLQYQNFWIDRNENLMIIFFVSVFVCLIVGFSIAEFIIK